MARLWEIQGFNLKTLPNSLNIKSPSLPQSIPLIYHSSARSRSPKSNFVALSLYELIDRRKGVVKFFNRDELLNAFKLSTDAQIILSGTETDPLLERWWGLSDRTTIIRRLRELGITLITAPNYSLFNDVPRTDNLYNMKRIAIVWSEIQRGGIPCAIHLNARTDKDWERWQEFINARNEISWLAFEFGTGAGSLTRINWHIQHLVDLAKKVRHPLRIIMRGGWNSIGLLNTVYESVSYVDTSSFLRAQKRQCAYFKDGRLWWEKYPTEKGAPIDDLIDSNIETVSAALRELTMPRKITQGAECLV